MAGKAFGNLKTSGKPKTGGDGDDTLDASGGQDSTRINGGDGNDLIIGTDAADRVNAGDGNDTVTGGAGNDILFGNGGDDTAVFSGSIVDYSWVWSNGGTLNVSGADGDDQLKHFEHLQFDDFTFSIGADNAPFAVLRSTATTEENASLTLQVDAYDFDGDAVSVVSVSSARGSVTATEGLAAAQVSQMGSSEGLELVFDPLGDFNYLAVGEETVETVTLTLVDASGLQTTTTFDITVTGTNDAPTLSAAATTATEDGPVVTLDLAPLGDDVDSDDDGSTLAYSVTGAPAEGSASISGTTLSFDPGNDFQDLAQGETRDVVIEITATDGHGATAVNTVTVTVTGTNDAPSVSVTGAGGFTEASDASAQLLADSGTVSFADIDASDTIDVSFADNGDIAWSGGTLEAATAAALVAGFATGTTDAAAPGATPWTYAATADLDFLGVGETISFSYTVTATDSAGASASEVVSFTLTGSNDGPVALADSNTGPAVVEQGSSVTGNALASGNALANDSDPDANDVLTVSSVAGDAANVGASVTGTYGALVLAADGSWTYTLDDGNPATDALTDGQIVTETFNYEVSDGQGGTATATISIEITGSEDNRPPVAADATVNGFEDIAITGSLPTSDPDGDTLTHTLVSGPSNGALILNTDGSYSYTPNADFHGSDSFSYQVDDGNGETATGTITLDVASVNDAPTMGFGTANAQEDGAPVEVDLAALASDPDAGEDGSTLSYSVSTAPGEGSASISGSTLTFDPGSDFQDLAEGETRSVAVGVTATDAGGASVTTTVFVEVSGTNDAPVAQDFELVANVTGNSSFDNGFDGWTQVSAPQTGPNGETLNLSRPYNYSFTIDTTGSLIPGDTSVANIYFDGWLSSYYDGPNIGTVFGPSLISDAFAGNAGDLVSFEYRAYSGGDAASIRAVLVNIDTGAETQVFFEQTPRLQTSPVRQIDVPIPDAGNYRIEFSIGSFDATDGGYVGARLAIGTAGITRTGVTEGETQTFEAVQFTSHGTDVDNGAVITLASVEATSAMGASVGIDASGAIVYDTSTVTGLAEGETTYDVITYTLTDEHGATSTAEATVLLIGTNDAPVADPSSVTGSEDSAITGTVTASDPDGDALTYALATGPAHGTLVLNSDGSYTYTPSAEFSGTDSFTFVANDGSTDSAPETVTITVDPVNDAPSAGDDTLASGTDENTVHVIAASALLANDSDIEGDALVISGVAATSSRGAELTLNADGSISYDPTTAATLDAMAPGDTLDDSFSYTVSDGNGGFATATVTLTVSGVNDPPVLTGTTGAQSGFTDTAFSLTLDSDLFTDHDGGQTITYAVTLSDGSALPAFMSYDAATRTLSYAANAPQIGDVGLYALLVTATEPDGSSSTTSFTLSILDGSLIEGTPGNDTLTGTIQGDLIAGLGGHDSIIGLPGSDFLDGGDDNDTLYGQAGDDVLIGGNGNDRLYGEDGNDSLSAGDGYSDSVYGGDGDDTLDGGTGTYVYLNGDNGDDSISGGSVDNAYLNGGNGNDTMDGSSASVAAYLYTGNGSDFARGGAGDDVLQADSDSYSDDTLIGGAGNDRFYDIGYYSADSVNAGAGDDIVYLRQYGFASDISTITLGSGSDTIVLGRSYGWHDGYSLVTDFNPAQDLIDLDDFLIHQITGWDGSTNPFGDGYLRLVQDGTAVVLEVDPNGGGDSYLPLLRFENTSVGDFTADNFTPAYPPDGSMPAGLLITGTAGNDTLEGTIGTDTINGLAGHDVLFGGQADDTLDGGEGNDVLDGEVGNDVLIGGDGNDTLYGRDGDDSLSVGDGYRNYAYGDDGNDTLEAGSGDFTYLYGGNGDDSINAGTVTTAYLNGDGGDDTIDASQVGLSAYLGGGVGSDLMLGSVGNDTLWADTDSASDDTMIAGDGDDQFYSVGYNSADSVDAGAGDDLVELRQTGTETSTITLGSGADTIRVGNSNGWQTGYSVVTDFNTAEDLIDIEYYITNVLIDWDGSANPFAAGYMRLTQDGTAVVFEIDPDGGGDGYQPFLRFENTTVGDFTASNFTPAYPPDGSMPAGGQVINGTPGNDTLNGSISPDVIFGLAGNDFIDGGQSGDTIHGGDGSDAIYGNVGDDELYGEDGNDALYGEDGDDLLSLGDGTSQRAYGQDGNDTLDGGTGGQTTLFGGNGDDLLQTGAVSYAYLYGENGDDRLDGSQVTQFAVLNSGNGSDSVIGSVGNDVIVADRDAGSDDTIFAGEGNDTIDDVGYYSADQIDAGDGDDLVVLRLFTNTTEVTTITLGAGADMIALQNSHGATPGYAVVTDFDPTEDALDLDYFLTNQITGWDGSSNPFGDGHMRLVQDGSDVVFEIDYNGGGDSYVSFLRFQNVDVSDFTATNFLVEPATLEGYAPDGGGIFGTTLSGTAAGEALNGSIGDDVLSGFGGVDLLSGGNGNDTMDGGADDDVLTGGFGDDDMTGGTGADSFVFGRGQGNDVIQDFELGTDVLSLTGGQTIASLADVDSDGVGGVDSTLVTFADGATVLLETVTGVTDANDLL